MYKKITGVDKGTCRDNIMASKDSYHEYLSTLSAVKDLDQTRRDENDLERARIRKEQKEADMFKFGKMSKKKPFFPTLNTRGYLDPKNQTSFVGNLYFRLLDEEEEQNSKFTEH